MEGIHARVVRLVHCVCLRFRMLGLVFRFWALVLKFRTDLLGVELRVWMKVTQFLSLFFCFSVRLAYVKPCPCAEERSIFAEERSIFAEEPSILV